MAANYEQGMGIKMIFFMDAFSNRPVYVKTWLNLYKINYPGL